MSLKVGILHTAIDSHGSARRLYEISKYLRSNGHECEIYQTHPRKKIDLKVYEGVDEMISYDFMEWCDHIIFMAHECLEDVQKYADLGKSIWVLVTSAVASKPLRSLPRKWNFVCNNFKLRETNFPWAHLLEGAVPDHFKPKRRIRVGYHARKSDAVRKALIPLADCVEGVPIKGVLEDSDLIELYQSLDYFVSYETVGGWGNMAAEALACGTAVISWEGINCEAFRDNVIVVKDIAQFLYDPLKGLRYKDYCKKLEGLMLRFQERDGHFRKSAGDILREPEGCESVGEGLDDIEGQ
jgi:hypothetical protein